MYAALLGLGSGMMYPIFNAAAQNAVSKRELGVVTASMQFFRNIGSTVALPIFGVIVNITVNMNASTGSVAPSLMSAGIHNVFLSGLIISVVGLGICFLLEDVFLSSRLKLETLKTCDWEIKCFLFLFFLIPFPNFFQIGVKKPKRSIN